MWRADRHLHKRILSRDKIQQLALNTYIYTNMQRGGKALDHKSVTFEHIMHIQGYNICISWDFEILQNRLSEL
jgi:hypothetical protein